jgi:hypothetical protein
MPESSNVVEINEDETERSSPSPPPSMWPKRRAWSASDARTHAQ